MHRSAFASSCAGIAMLAIASGGQGTERRAPSLSQLDQTIRAFLAREQVPAAHVTVLRGEAVVFERGYGSVHPGSAPPTPRSVFPIGSISKQFTAATVLALADAGALRLDALVRDHLPEWFAGDPELRVTHLLTHTSGLADFLWLDGYRALADRPDTSKEAFVTLATRAPRRFAPGERWSYSNTNYKALALIVERVSGRPFDAVLAERVLRPLNLETVRPCHDLAPGDVVAGFGANGKPAPLDASRAAYTGDGGLCADAIGMRDWVRRGLRAGHISGAGPGRLAAPTRLASGQAVPYGYGLSTREFLGHAMLWHAGNVDGHSALIAHAPQDDLSIVVLTNRGFVWLTELLPPWIGAVPPSPAPASGQPPLGRFEDGLFTYDLSPEGEGGAVRVAIDLIGPLVFVPAGPGRLVARDLPASFLLRLPADGSLESFELDWGEVRSYARRLPSPAP